MNLLYTEEELSRLSARIKRRRILTWILAVPFFALFVFFFIMHKQVTYEGFTMIGNAQFSDQTLKILAAVNGVVCAWILVFGITFCIKPLKAYRTHIRNSLSGRTHDVSYHFKAVEPDISVIDHIRFKSLVLDGEPDKHGLTEHMFYWDELKEIPAFKEGSGITIRYYDRYICGWSGEISHTSSVNVE